MTVASTLPLTTSHADTSAAAGCPGTSSPRTGVPATRRATSRVRAGRRVATAPLTAAVVGASGFTGALLAELLLRHPGVPLEQMSSEQLAGAPVARALPEAAHRPLVQLRRPRSAASTWPSSARRTGRRPTS